MYIPKHKNNQLLHCMKMLSTDKKILQNTAKTAYLDLSFITFEVTLFQDRYHSVGYGFKVIIQCLL